MGEDELPRRLGHTQTPKCTSGQSNNTPPSSHQEQRVPGGRTVSGIGRLKPSPTGIFRSEVTVDGRLPTNEISGPHEWRAYQVRCCLDTYCVVSDLARVEVRKHREV